MNIPFVDLKAQYDSIKHEIDEAILSVLPSSQFALGSFVAAFENSFARYCGVAECAGVNSGTSALHLALLAAGVGPGDEVITTPHTFMATAAAIIYAGGTPVFVDIDPATCQISPCQIEDAITSRTKVILPVHLYGHPADMDAITEIARKRNLIVIEDAAQAHGAEYNDRRCGSLGHMACFSFYPGKNLGAYGEGGAIVSNDKELMNKIRILRDWGQEKKYHHDVLGFNYRMEGIQGAVLTVKLTHIEDWTKARRANAAQYDKLLENIIERPSVAPNVRHVYHVYAVRHPRRDELQHFLQERNIHTGIHYPIPLHTQKALASLGYSWGDFPHTEKAASEVLSLPMFAELTDIQMLHVAEAIQYWVNNNS